MYIATNYRGRITLSELLELDMPIIATLNKMTYEEIKSSSKRDQNELAEDVVTGNY